MSAAKSVLIVEDEPLIADDIALTLKGNGYDVVGPVDNAEEAAQAMTKSKPSLVLLDIHIKGGKDGIALASEVRRHKLPFIYITSFYDRETLDRAMATEPQGYIVKPFDEKDLLINIEVALFKHRKAQLAPGKVFVKEKNEMVAIEVRDILYAEAFDNYCKIFTDKHSHIISHTLKQVEEKLPPQSFLRVHRSYVVNFEKVTSINESNVCLGLVKIPLAQSFRQEVMERIAIL
jgi:DNA-binding LytR/AlgR family response regulator